MSASDEPAPGIVGVATSGIQDISALLPLLGTEQCENLVSSALQDGFLYAAATPMSIFGSLGIVKAGFIVLWGSIDHRYFPGPTLLKNAGIVLTGVRRLLVPVATENATDKGRLYVAEDKLRRHLSNIRIHAVTVNLRSNDLWRWNLRLVFMTALLSSLGLLPYLYLIKRTLSDASFKATWLYPVLRIVGCDLVAVSIQFTFQLRILEEVYCRLRFLAADRYLEDNTQRTVPSFWDPSRNSKGVLTRLRGTSGFDHLNKLALEFKETGKFTSFRFQTSTREKPPGSQPPRSRPSSPPPPHSPPFHPPHRSSDSVYRNAGTGDTTRRNPFLGRPLHDRLMISLPLLVVRASLVFGLGLSVVGYIGCFSVVQAKANTGTKGPLVWLSCEAALAIVRTLFWAWNPPRDDAPSPIVLEKFDPTLDLIDVQGPRQRGGSNLYGLGWMLDLSISANDVHAVVVGIHVKEDDKRGNLHALAFAGYLQDTLLVPGHQVVTLTNAQATRANILEALNHLSHRVPVRNRAPVIIYFSTGSSVHGGEPRLLTWPETGPNGDVVEHASISYTTIVDILQGIAEERTENITLLLECRHAQAMDLHEQAKALAVGRRYHILLGPTPTDDDMKGLFTLRVLRALASLTGSTNLSTMTYESFIELVNSPENPSWKALSTQVVTSDFGDSGEPGLEHRKIGGEAFCTGPYPGRLLLGGLFSRMLNDRMSDPVITISYTDLDVGGKGSETPPNP